MATRRRAAREPLPPAGEFPAPPRLLTAEEIVRGAREVADLARNHGVRVVLIGSVAMHAYGSPSGAVRVTVAATSALPLCRECAPSGGCATTSGVPVDVVIRRDKYKRLYRDAIDSAQYREGVPLPVVRPEELIAMAMVSARASDHADVDYLLGTGAIDHARARKVVGKHLGKFAVDVYVRRVEAVVARHAREAWLRCRP